MFESNDERRRREQREDNLRMEERMANWTAIGRNRAPQQENVGQQSGRQESGQQEAGRQQTSKLPVRKPFDKPGNEAQDVQPSTSGIHLQNPRNPFYNCHKAGSSSSGYGPSSIATENRSNSTDTNTSSSSNEVETLSGDFEFHDAFENFQQSSDQRKKYFFI